MKHHCQPAVSSGSRRVVQLWLSDLMSNNSKSLDPIAASEPTLNGPLAVVVKRVKADQTEAEVDRFSVVDTDKSILPTGMPEQGVIS